MCRHGCVYATIQSAVNHAGRGATIDVKPGRYVEGVIVSGHRHDGLRIIGLGRKPAAGSSAHSRASGVPYGNRRHGSSGSVPSQPASWSISSGSSRAEWLAGWP